MPSTLRGTIIAATRNHDKVVRIGRLIGGQYGLAPLPDGVSLKEPDPDRLPRAAGDPFAAIAMAKAVSASSLLDGAMTIATDGGLVVPALGDRWQPARTRRFAGAHATNRERAEALLALAADLEGDERRVHWREAVAVSRDGAVVLTATAESRPGCLATGLTDWTDDGQGFWVHVLWRDSRGGAAPHGAADEHWERLGAIVGPFLSGLTERIQR